MKNPNETYRKMGKTSVFPKSIQKIHSNNLDKKVSSYQARLVTTQMNFTFIIYKYIRI